MCGIAGIVYRGDGVVDPALLERMNAVQAHRGPDAGTTYLGDGVGLAHRRLAIIDVSGSDQPMFNEDGRVVLVYNGEIYNFAEVRAELLERGHVFKTSGDTEVVVHAWEEWGEACVSRFRGMFAFALWDDRRKCLFLARDRLGIKPLYVAELNDGAVVFGSELKALLEHTGLARQLDPQAVEDYFAFGYIPDPKTILKGVRRLEPGHTLLIERGRRAAPPRGYWQFAFGPRLPGDEAEWTEELPERLAEAVRIRLISDVPLGAFLSGGIDSSAVVAMMARVAPGDRMNTCSISFGDPRFNESEYARQVAERYNTNHHVRQVDPDDFGLLDDLAQVYDEPFADPSALPTYRLCQLARERVTVALSGDGGDEMLAGYTRYRFHMAEERLRACFPAAVRRLLFGPLGRLYPKADWAPKVFRARSTFQSLAMETTEAYMNTVSLMGNDLRRRLFSDAFRGELQGYTAIEVFRGHLREAPDLDALSLAQYLDVKTYLAGDILTKVDRASMAHSLEVRVPLLDHVLVEWMARLPPEARLRGGEGKYILKKALEPFLPHDILYRRKMGFSVPLATWFRGPLLAQLRARLARTADQVGHWFDMDFVERMLRQHESGMRDNSEYLWAMLMFSTSVRRLLG